MRSSVWCLMLLTLAACGDGVSSRYATLADARADGLFGRGWMPDLLPPSSARIQVNNDLDANTSYGEFHFPVAEGPALFARLTAGAAPHSQVDDPPRGYQVWHYNQDNHTWTFFCRPDKGVCQYEMSMRSIALPPESP